MTGKCKGTISTVTVVGGEWLPYHHCENRRLGNAQSQFGCFGRKKIPSCQQSKSSYPACSLVTVLTENYGNFAAVDVCMQ